MFLANFLIALREGVEASLVVGIIAAYLVKSGHREALRTMWVGVGIAVLLPISLGAILTWGPKTLTFQAQEIIGGILSLVAAALVTWMIFWMGRNARQIKAELESQLSAAVTRNSAGRGIAWIAIIAVGREGMETALFIWATVKSSVATNTWLTVIGVVSGFAIAFALGYLLYRGAVRINLRRFFVITGYFLIVVAAGIVSYGIGDLQEASVLPGIMTHAWDLSGSLPHQSSPAYWLYVLAAAMFQLNVQPTVLQVIGWASYLLPTTWVFHRATRIPAPLGHISERPKEEITS